MNKYPIGERQPLNNQKHVLKIMKATVFLLFFSVWMTMASTIYSQESKFLFTSKHTSIKEVCKELEQKSDYKFIFAGNANKQLSKKVNTSDALQNIEQILDHIFSGTELSYRILKDQVVVYVDKNKKIERKTEEVKPTEIVQQDKKTITGKVVDEKGEPIIGANIVEAGTTNGTATDIDGNFTIQVKNNATLHITYIGYLNQDVDTKGKTTLSIILKEDNQTLQDVVVTGYLNKTKESFTGAAETFTGAEITKLSTGNVLNSLSNLDPSFILTENINSGNNPNAVPEFQVRGTSNLRSEVGYSSNNPTFILDGFEVSSEKVFDIDPNRILSVTILKDASATAIYGSRASNGIVVIETKKPTIGEIKKTYIFSSDFEFADLSDYNLMNASEKLEYERLAGLYDHHNASVKDRLMDVYNERLAYVKQGINTQWIKLPVHRATFSQKHSLALEGGSKELTYALLMHYRNHKGIMKKSGRDNLGIEMQLQYLYKNLKFMNNMSFAYVNQFDSPYGSFANYTKLNPYYNPYGEDGQIQKILSESDGVVLNPLYNSTLGTRYQKKHGEFINNFSLEWTLSEALRFKSRFSFYKRSRFHDTFLPANHTAFHNLTAKGSYDKLSSDDFGFDSNAVLAYTKQYSKHFFNSVLIWNAKQDQIDNYLVTATGYPNDFMDHIGMGIEYKAGSHPSGDYTISRLMGLAGNINYLFDERFLVDLSIRTDGSSIYGAEKRWGTFGSIGAGWNLHKEKLIKNTKIFDELKLRASWGTTGGQNFYPFQAMMMYSYNDRLIKDLSYNSYKGALLKSYGNNNLQWQRTEKFNIGLDFSLWNRTIWGYVNLYNDISKSLLIDVQLAPSTGFNSYKENLGQIGNRGIETNINFRLIKSKSNNFSWNIFANASMNRNKLLKIDDALVSYNRKQDEALDKNKEQTPMIRYQEGQSVNTIWANESLGIDPNTGEEVFLNQNGEKVNYWSTKNYKPLGCEDPKISGNFGTMVFYRGFTLQTYFQFQYGGDIYNQTLVNKVENVNPLFNGDKRILYDRWKEPGDITYFKAITNTSKTLPTSRFIERMNYIRLSSLNLSYDFPKDIISSYHLEGLKFSLIGNDLFRFSTVRMERGIYYPYSRTISLTTQVTF